ncbi:MAG: LptF/LptG family permease [Gemmatimonadales bacterium]|nr:LptF/LptG family permease [Gemmatimonadales bacterium]
MRLLDRYILFAWLRTFAITAVGFPVIAAIINLNDNVNRLLERGLSVGEIAYGYLFHLPQDEFLALPAAVLVATVFTVSGLGRRSELTAAIASGQSLYRLLLPVWVAAAAVVGIGIAIGEYAPVATARQLRIHKQRSDQPTDQRYNFVYRAEQGWVYVARLLEVSQRQLREPIFERQGTGADYPTLLVSAQTATYDTVRGFWKLDDGRSRVIAGPGRVWTFDFRTARLRALAQSPADLLAEPKAPEEMRYAELGRYIEALKRSGNDAGKLEVERALKIAVPVTCLIIALFAAPIAVTTGRSGPLMGIAVSLATTIGFLLLAQIAKAVGDGGVVDPDVAAWLPNGLFALLAAVLLARART